MQVTSLSSPRFTLEKLTPEQEVVSALVDYIRATSSPHERESVFSDAVALVKWCRAHSDEAGPLDAFLQEFGLSNKEGVALMCLAESLLRVGDDQTADRLIAEKIQSGDWHTHKGKSLSPFVNASVWGLMLTGQLVDVERHVQKETGSWIKKLSDRVGESAVRHGILQAMRIMGRQFVLGRDISEAISRADELRLTNQTYSFDMLGEGARTAASAEQYYASYVSAIKAVGRFARHSSPLDNDGISVKLSALFPRYEVSQRGRVLSELQPRLLRLAQAAKAHNIGLSVDAEESERLDLSLEIFESLLRDKSLADWDGLGFVLQAYQKRAPAVADLLAEMAAKHGRKIAVRLVKGAYWDREIKHAQEQGHIDYPVYTRKPYTDLAYEVCARKLFATSDVIYPQFATHNAYTLALITRIAGAEKPYELQRLHGMGELLYKHIQKGSDAPKVRVYAPVGAHKDLLPYLVRRLLENGANSSFVNRLLDQETPAEKLVLDPLLYAEKHHGNPNSLIPTPRNLYAGEASSRANAIGVDLDDQPTLAGMVNSVKELAKRALPVITSTAGLPSINALAEVVCPAEPNRVVGRVAQTSERELSEVFDQALAAQQAWAGKPVDTRAVCIERLADLLERDLNDMVAIIVTEAGRTYDDAVSEVREAVDFCRYYAASARALMSQPIALPGPTGEANTLSYAPKGTFVCISPWNFPLAIFLGQITAALVTGNTVVAKPAEQTPIIAHKALQLMGEAGIPKGAINLVYGEGGRLGEALVTHKAVSGVVFTGSTHTAQTIANNLLGNINAHTNGLVPLVAETGGLNTMLVDATALPEQVVDDVIASAFKSAGQRCSALRVLYLHDAIADEVLGLLKGAINELVLGDPRNINTDIGPLIDERAQTRVNRHIDAWRAQGAVIAECAMVPNQGYFVPPTIVALQSISQLKEEIFGPVLHVIRYHNSDLPRIYSEINATGYALTLGVHSRIQGFAREVFESTRAGNTYVNRNMVGAVVGVNPFGGSGLSGTGFKAGGPNYLLRFVNERTYTDNLVATGGNAQLLNLAVDD